MQNLTLALVFALVSVSLFAQQPDAVAANRERPRMSRSPNYGNWVGQTGHESRVHGEGSASSPEQAQKLKEEMEKIDARLKTLDEEIHTAAALQQADIAKKVLVGTRSNQRKNS
jgi:hypothetical protein